ncbi:winged helix-turn-helix domain-containing protein [Candidatus Chloroploca sp. Khr17]|uniref:winged helix-turn-helix domain-containing protein n=1 Tax=Candidatus Chloroploca sp. Khr17 TaxID=2496869 RepID=UPI00101C87EA|nr:winged helix-turn-helix domain-containing protein [Candidatus Chloroploca sp. Khr17]
MQNHFFYRGPIRDRRYLYGREPLLERALAFITSGQSVALIGPRRIGKTSLLLQLGDPALYAQIGHEVSRLHCVYLDCQSLIQASPEMIYGRLLAAIGEGSEAASAGCRADGSEGVAFAQFEAAIEYASSNGYALIFLLDEFESLLANTQLDHAFYTSLRALATTQRVVYVLASSCPLLELDHVHLEAWNVALLNDFAVIHLGLLSVEASRLLLQELSARSGFAFDEPLIEQLLELAGCHPLLLQIAGYHAIDLLKTDELQHSCDVQMLERAFLSEAAAQWSAMWHRLNLESKQMLALFALLAPTYPAAVRRLEACGLVMQGADGQPTLLSVAFRRFVAEQEVPGVIQVPPVTLVPSLKTALLRGEPLPLPPQQFELLSYLVEHRQRIVSREELTAALWGRYDAASLESLRTALRSLREALGEDQGCIQILRGHGCQFVALDLPVLLLQ